MNGVVNIFNLLFKYNNLLEAYTAKNKKFKVGLILINLEIFKLFL